MIIGWFAVITSSKEPFLRCYKALDEILKANVEEILIGGDQSIAGFVPTDNGTYVNGHMSPGEIWKIHNQILVTNVPSSWKLSGHAQKSNFPPSYLRCTDSNDREVIVSTSEKGQFYPVSVSGQRLVMQLADINRLVGLPCKVQLLYGRTPNVPCLCTGWFSLHSISSENIAIASTMLNRRNLLIELELDTDLKFEVADEIMENCGNDEYDRTLAFYKDSVDEFSRSIKVKAVSRPERHYSSPLPREEENTQPKTGGSPRRTYPWLSSGAASAPFKIDESEQPTDHAHEGVFETDSSSDSDSSEEHYITMSSFQYEVTHL